MQNEHILYHQEDIQGKSAAEMEDLLIRDLINSCTSTWEPNDDPVAFSLKEMRWLSAKEIMKAK